MRVTPNGQWAIASRDFFKATGCEHCVRLSMAVKAKVPAALAKVEPFQEDLSTKLPIIQGNQRERIVFDQIWASLPSGDFVEFERASVEQTVAAMNSSTPVIAQGFFARELQGYEWSGYADLLVLEGYEISQTENGRISAAQVGPIPSSPKYMPWDVKASSSGDPKYQVQLAAYWEALQELGLASEEPMGIVLGFNRGVVRYEPAGSLDLYQAALAQLTAILNLTTPSTITADFIQGWACAKASVCGNVYCDYPKLCEATFDEQDVLELLHSMDYRHSPKLRAAGFNTVSALAASEECPDVPGLDSRHVERYWRGAQVMQVQRNGQKALLSKIAGRLDLPQPTDRDLFFDVEWFNPVDSSGEFIFMFGAVTSDESFRCFIAETPEKELEAFDHFLDRGMSQLEANPDMHIYHYHNPEPKKVEMLVKRYGGHRAEDAEKLISRMFDLRPVAMEAFVPGSGSYSIKSLEKYYGADTKLNRGELVAGGADAMYQFELFRVALAEGRQSDAGKIMGIIADYNKDDCLSTKLLYDWLRSLKFETVNQTVLIA